MNDSDNIQLHIKTIQLFINNPQINSAIKNSSANLTKRYVWNLADYDKKQAYSKKAYMLKMNLNAILPPSFIQEVLPYKPKT